MIHLLHIKKVLRRNKIKVRLIQTLNRLTKQKKKNLPSLRTRELSTMSSERNRKQSGRIEDEDNDDDQDQDAPVVAACLFTDSDWGWDRPTDHAVSVSVVEHYC